MTATPISNVTFLGSRGFILSADWKAGLHLLPELVKQGLDGCTVQIGEIRFLIENEGPVQVSYDRTADWQPPPPLPEPSTESNYFTWLEPPGGHPRPRAESLIRCPPERPYLLQALRRFAFEGEATMLVFPLENDEVCLWKTSEGIGYTIIPILTD